MYMLIVMSVLIGVATRRALVAGAVAALVSSWPLWYGALSASSDFWMIGIWALMESGMVFCICSLSGFVGLKAHAPSWLRPIAAAIAILLAIATVVP